MEKNKAITAIEDTFDCSFDKDKFTLFVKNLLNDIDTTKHAEYRGNLIKGAFRDHIAQYTRIGKYSDPNGIALDVLAIEVKDETKLDKARTSLRNFVINHLKTFDKDYALAAFYSRTDSGRNWRFSFVKLEHTTTVKDGKIKQHEELTPARRYSFLVGVDEKSYTAKRQLLPLLQNVYNNPLIEDLEKAFSIEVVTDEFFEQYKGLFSTLSEHFQLNEQLKTVLRSAETDIPRFTKKLLGQIVFLYFLQKKGWLGVPKDEKWGNGQKNFLQLLYQKSEEEGRNFFRKYLQYLFYEALASQHGSDNYYKRFDCRIPFLNGGLFEADYDWQNFMINIPNSLFRNNEKDKKTGDIGSGILDVFDRYNFTIREDEPLEKEVAVDPEMLGKVFENMLEVTERKSKGAFYTPREIVHYMCQESLIHYLDNALNNGSRLVPKEEIEDFVRKGIFTVENDMQVIETGNETDTYKYKLPESIRNNADKIDALVTRIKICDPAIGSGAFPVGLLNELVNLQIVLREHLSKDYLTKKLNIIGLSLGEYSVSSEKYNYRVKRHSIQESIYGVDIDPSAIDIARLRLWLSLVVDEEDFDNIEALPNLDYKIVCGDSLISKYDDDVIEIDWDINNNQLSLFGNRNELREQQLLREISEKQEAYFDPKTIDKKIITVEIRNLKIDILINQLDLMIRTKGLETEPIQKGRKFKEQMDLFLQTKKWVETVEKLNKLRETPCAKLKYFDWKLDFPEILNPYLTENTEKKGFDIIVGNPPYGAAFNEEDKEILKNRYSHISDRIRNSFLYFLGNSKTITTLNGSTCFIIPNEFLFQIYMSKARHYFLSENRILKVINIGDNAFKAVVPTCVVLIDKNKQSKYDIDVLDCRTDTLYHIEQKIKFINFPKISSQVILESPNHIFSFDTQKSSIISSLIAKGTTFEDYCLDIANGISTSCDEIYVVDKDLIENKNFEIKHVKPSLKGKDITKYKTPKTPPRYILYIDKNFNINEAPNVYKYLEENKELLISKSVEKKSGLRNWYILFRSRDENLFTSTPKILVRQTGDSIIASIDYNTKYYCIDSLNVIVIKQKYISCIRFFLSILNSELIDFYYREISQEAGRVLAQVKPSRIKSIPIVGSDNYQLFTIVSFYLEFIEKQSKAFLYFTHLLDSMIYELYFPEEIHAADKGIIEHLKDLKPIDDSMTDSQKLSIINSEFERLYDPYHPVRNNVDTIESVEVVRIIKESLQK